MTTNIKPHGLFEVWSADDVAECLDGVGIGDLYRKLWDNVIPVQNTPGLDYRELPDGFAERCLALSWHKFTAEEQTLLNQLAKKNDEDMWGGSPVADFLKENE